MFAHERWNRTDLLIGFAILLAISLCCPVLIALDDEDSDLPPIILPGFLGTRGGGHQCGLAPAYERVHPEFQSGDVLPAKRPEDLIIVFNANCSKAETVPDCGALAGLRISCGGDNVFMTGIMSGDRSPDTDIAVSAPQKMVLDLYTDGEDKTDSCVILPGMRMNTTLDKIVSGLFQLDVNSGAEAVNGAVFVLLAEPGMLDDVRTIHTLCEEGVGGVSKTYIPNGGRLDLTELIQAMDDSGFGGDYFSFGAVQFGYDGSGNIISITNLVVTAYPQQGSRNPIETRVYTLD